MHKQHHSQKQPAKTREKEHGSRLGTSFLQLWDRSQVNFPTSQEQTVVTWTKGLMKDVLSRLDALEKEVFAS